MRIKKKNIKENLGDKTKEKVDYVKDAIVNTGDELKNDLDIEDEVADSAATDIVTGALAATKAEKRVTETINPMMTKSELIETVLRGKQKRKVIKTLKVKDLK